MKQSVIYTILLLTIIYSCKPPQKESNPVPASTSTGIYVVNEGNFMAGNGSVSFYDSSTNTVTQDLFYAKNNKPAGDVCQSLAYYNSQFYLVVNNSSKIEVLDNNFINTKTIQGFTSPRYIAFTSNTKGYVTDLYGKGVSILNTSTQTIEKKIVINYWTEELVNYQDTIYVTSPSSQYLYLIDGKTEQLKDSINIGYGSSSIAIDGNNTLWVLCNGNQSLSILPTLICIDPAKRIVIRTITSADYSSLASKIHYNPIDKYMYWIDGDIYRINTTDQSSAKEIFIAAAGRNFYGLGIKTNNGDIIVSDAGDYSQRSTIYLYAKNGVERNSFKAGLISGFMLAK
jgi:hypothetical protein